MRQPFVILATLLGAAVTFATTPPARSQPGASGLVLYHTWTSPSDLSALDALLNVFKKTYPGVGVETALGDDRSRMFSMVRSVKPDAFQIVAGSALEPFLETGLVSDVDGVWESEGLDRVIPAIVQRLNRHGGHYYSIPIAVHRSNVVWYNKPLLEKHQIDPDTLTTWDAFFKAAAKLRAEGVRYPIQMGVNWTGTLVLEGIVAGEGTATYEDWINGKVRATDDPRSLAAFNTFKQYLGYVNDDHATTAWELSIMRVLKGEGAFTIMSDWADGRFRIAGMKYGKEYGTFPVPGTRGLYILNVDAFALARQRPNDTNAERWMKVVGSREGQDVFNAVKGSISPRTDADPLSYGPYQRSALSDLKSAQLIPSMDGVTPETFKVRQASLVSAFLTDLDVTRAAAAVAAASMDAESKFTQTWSLGHK